VVVEHFVLESPVPGFHARSIKNTGNKLCFNFPINHGKLLTVSLTTEDLGVV
jgi:hypothetical protein